MAINSFPIPTRVVNLQALDQSVADAAASATQAEAARDAAFVSAGSVGGYATTAAGLADTVIGDRFSAPDGDDIQLYIHEAGPVATPVAGVRYPSAERVDGLIDKRDTGQTGDIASVAMVSLGNTFSYVFNDPQERAGKITKIEVKANVAGDVSFRVYERRDGQFLRIVSQQTITVTTGYQVLSVDIPIKKGQLFGFRSGTGLVGRQSTGTGVEYFGINGDEAIQKTISTAFRLLIRATVEFDVAESEREGIVPAGVNFIDMAGQSNAEGRGTPITTGQIYDARGYVKGTLDPANSVVLASGSVFSGTAFETPGFAVAQVLRELAMQRDGVAPGGALGGPLHMGFNTLGSRQFFDFKYWGGASDFFRRALSQLAKSRDEADADGTSIASAARFFSQGEQDAGVGTDRVTDYSGTVRETYGADLADMVADWDREAGYITRQSRTSPTVINQLSFIGSGGSFTASGREVALAQLDVALSDPRCIIACPSYHLPYMDLVHFTNVGARRLGAYMAYAYADWVKIGAFDPLRPVQVTVSGNTITARFNRFGLSIDTTIVPAQSGSGFAVEASGGAPIAVTSVSASGNVVTIECASSPAGGSLGYGVVQTGMGAYDGFAGNLRDSAGDTRTFEGARLDNWCVLFDWNLA